MKRPAPAPGAFPARLFVYGTLVDADVRRAVIGRVIETTPARISGYELRVGRYPYLIRKAGGRVQGLVLSGLTLADLATLDAYEAVDPSLIEGELRRLYHRELKPVSLTDGGRRPCWIYLPNLRDWPSDWG